MIVLGIETSCDDTSLALYAPDRGVIANVTASQLMHDAYGGVVPEIASRQHMRALLPVYDALLAKAGIQGSDIDGIGVSNGPGLVGSLLVGVGFAKSLALGLGKPVVGVHHIEAHVISNELAGEALQCPAIVLIVSGGHTALYRVDGPELARIRELGATRDDAAGEAFDKVAKLLGLGYPGGPIVDRLAKEGDPDAIDLIWPMRRRGSLEFSFSGLKTDVMRWVTSNGRPGNDKVLRDLCAAFQRRVVDTLVEKTVAAALAQEVSTIVIAGGVAANRELRERAAMRAGEAGLRLVVPPFRACTDNAAMIAYAGAKRLERGEDDSGKLETSPRTSLPRITVKGRGKRAAP